MSHELDERTKKLLKEVVDHFDKEDVSIRERQIRQWRRLKLLWEGFAKTWYSEVAHDWRIWDEAEGDDTNQAYYDKPINVFRAYLESIIAALSVVVPPVKCFPDDANNTLDLSTARAGDKIAQLIYRHNDVPLLWLHALFIYCTEGMVACYSYPKEDESYGQYDDKKYDDVEEEHQYTECPNCGYMMDDEIVTPESQAIKVKLNQNADKFQPDDSDVPIQNMIQDENLEYCPACQQLIIPMLSQEKLVVTRLIGITKEPKTRVCMEAYGGLYVKVANYAKTQADSPYLIYAYETHYANAIQRYDHLHDEIREKIKASTGPRDPYEQWGRLSPQYQGEYPQNIVTVRNAWLRPSAMNVLKKEDADELKEKYPNGAKVVLISDCVAEAVNEALDDCWTLTRNPLSDYIHFDPLGLLLVSIQEITNDLISLTLQTVEHGIGQTFADPGVLNFDAYRQMEAIPGGIYEAKPKSGQTLSQGFHEVKTAQLSGEVMPFSQQIQNLGQVVSGALPSLFGGSLEGSETASQYSMSRAQALQRLQNTWKMFTIWWKEIFGKAIPMFIKETKNEGDERDVQLDSNGDFINVFIRRADLEGKIGKVELEANENLPLTWSQQKDLIMQLFEINNPQILEVIGSPENLPAIREAIGLTTLHIPGEDDREKQLDEIKILLQSAPMPNPMPMPGMPPMMSSIQVDPIYDNHAVEFETVRKWVVSEAGRQAKVDNPEGHENVMLHGQQHMMFMQGQQMQNQQVAGAETATEDTQTPITGEENVQTVQ